MLKGSCEKKKLSEVSGVTELKKLKIRSSCMSSDCWQVRFYCSGWNGTVPFVGRCLSCGSDLSNVCPVALISFRLDQSRLHAAICRQHQTNCISTNVQQACVRKLDPFLPSPVCKGPPRQKRFGFLQHVLLLAVSELAVAAACLWTSQERRGLKIHQSAK